MTPYGQLLRFHSVAEFSSYCTSVLSLSYNASNTKYSTRGVSSYQYRYNKSNNMSNAGLPPCSYFNAQPETQRRKLKGNKTKTKSIFLDIHKGSTNGHQRQETLLKFEKRNNIYKQVWTLPTRPLWGSVQSRPREKEGVWDRGGGLSQVDGEERRREVSGWGEVERERRTKSTPPFTGLLMSVYHALEKRGVTVKVTAIPWKLSSLWSF